MEKSNSILTIVKGIFLSFLLTFILILIYSALLAYTNLSENTIPIILFIIGMLSVFISSSISSIKIKKNGLKNGGLIGLCYVMILYILSSIEVGFSLSSYSVFTIIFYVLLGMLGGIIGVNMVNKKI